MGARLGRGGQEASVCDLLGARLLVSAAERTWNWRSWRYATSKRSPSPAPRPSLPLLRRSRALALTLPDVAALPERDGAGQAGNRGSLALPGKPL
jgi:hypothetical protein